MAQRVRKAADIDIFILVDMSGWINVAFFKGLWYLGAVRKYYYEIDGIITVNNVEIFI